MSSRTSSVLGAVSTGSPLSVSSMSRPVTVPCREKVGSASSWRSKTSLFSRLREPLASWRFSLARA